MSSYTAAEVRAKLATTLLSPMQLGKRWKCHPQEAIERLAPFDPDWHYIESHGWKMPVVDLLTVVSAENGQRTLF